MAGIKCSGHALKTANSRESKAYCEGMAYRASDTAANAPITDNPHNAGDMKDAWDAGWDVADAAAGGAIGKVEAGCCAMRGAAVSA